MKGTVISPGGDWIVERPTGRVSGRANLLQTDDARRCYVCVRGIA